MSHWGVWGRMVIYGGGLLFNTPLLAAIISHAPATDINYERLYYYDTPHRLALIYNRFSYTEGGGSTLNPKLVIGSYSRALSPRWGIEVRLGLNGRGDETTIGSITTQLSIDRLYGIYARSNLPLGAYTTLQGVVGYTGVKSSATGIGSDSPHSLSYGFGLRYMWLERVSLDLEAMRTLDTTALTLDSIGLGIGLHF